MPRPNPFPRLLATLLVASVPAACAQLSLTLPAQPVETFERVDIAVEGIPLRQILDADVALCELLGVPTDLVAREENPTLYGIASDYGRVLFEAA
jgi:hypothetical protein